MDRNELLIREMAGQCRQLVQGSNPVDPRTPLPLHKQHLLWMCSEVDHHAADWSAAKLNRWIGFIQCALLANGVLDLEGLKTMFNHAKQAHGVRSDDLLDHLNPDCSFEFEIGGEG